MLEILTAPENVKTQESGEVFGDLSDVCFQWHDVNGVENRGNYDDVDEDTLNSEARPDLQLGLLLVTGIFMIMMMIWMTTMQTMMTMIMMTMP